MKRLPILLFLLLGSLGCQPQQRCEEGTYEDVIATRSLTAFGRVLANEYGMKFLFVGDVTDNPPDKSTVYYCLNFSSPKKMNLEEGQAFARSIAQKFEEWLQKDGSVKRQFDALRRIGVPVEERPSLARAAFRIDFWDEQVDRQMPPFLAEVFFVQGTISYYQAEPETQELRLVLKEPYEGVVPPNTAPAKGEGK